MPQRFLRAVVCNLLLISLAGSAVAIPLHADEVTTRAVSEILERYRENNEVPALAAAIVRLGKPTVVAAVGVRKRGDETPVEPADKFHLGSCTKVMTATLIARLVEQGKLKWNAPLGKLFPDLDEDIAPQLREVTLAHLLAHQSTLEDLEIGDYWKISAEKDLAKQRLEAVRRAVQQKSDKTAGKTFHYANINYIVAGSAAEQATGKTWEELIQTELFDPLKMASAGHGSMATPGKVDQPWSHRGDGEVVRPGPYGDNPTVIGPAGRVHCSLEDWAAFVTDQLRGAQGKQGVVQPQSYTQLHTPEFEGSGYTRGGWGTPGTPWGKGLAHDGSNTLNYSTAMLIPEKGLAILVVSNQGAPGVDKSGATACQQARGALLKLALGLKD
jgi:CubicO group peptidase (beta-lactamase class C family)